MRFLVSVALSALKLSLIVASTGLIIPMIDLVRPIPQLLKKWALIPRVRYLICIIRF